MTSQDGIRQGRRSRNRWELGRVMVEVSTLRKRASFGTGGTSHVGEAERILASQGGISQGRRSRNICELRWVQVDSTSCLGSESVAVMWDKGVLLSCKEVKDFGSIVFTEEIWCKDDSETW